MDSPVFILTIPLIVISLLSIRKLIKEKNKKWQTLDKNRRG